MGGGEELCAAGFSGHPCVPPVSVGRGVRASACVHNQHTHVCAHDCVEAFSGSKHQLTITRMPHVGADVAVC